MSKIMYAITHINEDGMRQLTFANQGRNHCETRELAEAKLSTILCNNSHQELSPGIRGARASVTASPAGGML